MNGIHDMGGMHGFGPIDPEPDEPVFHADWERSVYGLAAAMGPVADWTLDADRHALECIPGQRYLRLPYYGKWFVTMSRLLVEHGYITEEELESGRAQATARTVDRILEAKDVERYVNAGSRSDRDVDRPAKFGPGDAIRALNVHPRGHTRLPRYVRGHDGVIERIHGCHVFPDTNAHGEGEQPQWLYSVRFAAAELWGAGQPGRTDVCLDLWEPYLEAA